MALCTEQATPAYDAMMVAPEPGNPAMDSEITDVTDETTIYDTSMDQSVSRGAAATGSTSLVAAAPGVDPNIASSNDMSAAWPEGVSIDDQGAISAIAPGTAKAKPIPPLVWVGGLIAAVWVLTR